VAALRPALGFSANHRRYAAPALSAGELAYGRRAELLLGLRFIDGRAFDQRRRKSLKNVAGYDMTAVAVGGLWASSLGYHENATGRSAARCFGLRRPRLAAAWRAAARLTLAISAAAPMTR